MVANFKNNRILIIDDQEDILNTYKNILSPSDITYDDFDELEKELFDDEVIEDKNLIEEYQLDFAKQGLEGVEKVKKSLERNFPYAVAFIDMRMPPGIDGKETAKLIRQVDKEIEMVIVTAYSDHNRKEIVQEIGYPSKLLFLKKPFDVDEIKQLALALTEKWNLNYEYKLAEEKLKDYNKTLEFLVEERTRQLQETIKKLEVLSNTDPMTGLYNFRKFREFLDNEIKRAQRYFEKHNKLDFSFVVAILDLDDFKQINDNFGHLKGDFVLKTVSEVLYNVCRETDVVSRYGGDEFVIIFIDTNISEAEKICSRIIKQLSRYITFSDLVQDKTQNEINILMKNFQFSSLEEYFQIKVSIGLCEYAYGFSSEELIAKADSALYNAKIRGKNQIVSLELS